jgi:hypothetical protein
MQPRLENAGVVGPIFISIGDNEKLLKFLELNPAIPPENMFVDDYAFHVYNNVGFGTMKDFSSMDTKDITLSAPKLGGISGWWKYLSNVAAISPIEAGKTGIPEGVLRLGGTFVVNGDELLYLWKDKVPGNSPDLEQVMLFVEQ